MKKEIIRLSIRGKIFLFFIPIIILTGTLIFLVTAWSLSGFPDMAYKEIIIDRIKHSILPVALIGGAYLIICIVVIYFFTFLLISPIRDLRKILEKIGTGNFSIKTDVKSGDEIESLAKICNLMTEDLKKNLELLVDREKVKREQEISTIIQTSFLPKVPRVENYDIFARMITAEQAGGDYYDFIEGADGRRWYCIGDATSHGLTAALVSMAARSTIYAIIASRPEVGAADLVILLNRILYHCLKDELKIEECMTLSVIVEKDNTFTYAGAHESLFIYKKTSDSIITHKTPGMWLGIIEDISGKIVEKSFSLEKDDVLVLYTDGLIHAKNCDNEQFDIERLKSTIRSCPDNPAREIVETILKKVFKWCEAVLDDITVVVVKRVG